MRGYVRALRWLACLTSTRATPTPPPPPNLSARVRRAARLASSTMGEPADAKRPFHFSDYDCIGFDLDNTLARYKVGAMIDLEYRILARYLIVEKGYDSKYLQRPLDHNFIVKGLIIDNENGNLLRLGPDGTIIQASHGTRILDAGDILRYYPDRHWKATDLFIEDPLQTWNGEYSSKMRALLDYFDIVASMVFARCVDSIDERCGGEQKNYTVYEDVRDALQEMFDRDNFQANRGHYFPIMKSSPEKYYYQCSSQLLNWLRELRRRGKKLFLITGSHVDFADHTASHTLGPNWRDYFDVVVCYAKKPGFFILERDFIAVNDLKELEAVQPDQIQLGQVYTHGNWKTLHRVLTAHVTKQNPRFLYVGDNLVQDVYTPNVHSHCETVAVCEELEAEGVYGHERWHPDEQFLVSTIWGSYFHCAKTNSVTNWYQIMKSHSKLCVPSLEYVATFPVDHGFTTMI